ncbi:hypothetical protein SDC9_126535 [bioreactor metagenome]|uniref:Uncharacterized protein n=1 Tax=bioreactor metagenome TaxID=1076179 RepID=A0A645CRI1_9ZZZZ
MPKRERERHQRIPLLNRPGQRIGDLVPHALQCGEHTVPPGALVNAFDRGIHRHNTGESLGKRWIEQRDSVFLEHAPAGIDDLSVFQLSAAVGLIKPLERNLARFILCLYREHGHSFFSKEPCLTANTNLQSGALPIGKLSNRRRFRIVQIVPRQAKEQIAHTEHAKLPKQLRAFGPDPFYACQRRIQHSVSC